MVRPNLTHKESRSRLKKLSFLALSAFCAIALLTVSGCGNKAATDTSASQPVAGGTSSLPSQAQAAAQAQEKADAANHAAHAPH